MEIVDHKEINNYIFKMKKILLKIKFMQIKKHLKFLNNKL